MVGSIAGNVSKLGWKFEISLEICFLYLSIASNLVLFRLNWVHPLVWHLSIDFSTIKMGVINQLSNDYFTYDDDDDSSTKFTQPDDVWIVKCMTMWFRFRYSILRFFNPMHWIKGCNSTELVHVTHGFCNALNINNPNVFLLFRLFKY